MSSSEEEKVQNGFGSTFHSSQDSSQYSSRDHGSDSSEDIPLSRRIKSESNSPSPAQGTSNGRSKKRKDYRENTDSEDEEEPRPRKKTKTKTKNGKVKKEDSSSQETGGDDDDEDYEDFEPKDKNRKKTSSAKKPKTSKSSSSKSSSKKTKKKVKMESSSDSDSDTESRRKRSEKKKTKKKQTNKDKTPSSPKKKKVNEDEDEHVWKWWEESDIESDKKWKTLQHEGPVFAPEYERLPKSVVFRYNGSEMKLSLRAEEAATFYAKMGDHEYTQKEVFNRNFLSDWRKYYMTEEERNIIKDLKLCDFKPMVDFFKKQSEDRKAMSKEEKKVIKEANEELANKYGTCIVDGHKQKIGNFKMEPPGLFRGRGEHPKMGKIKRRIEAKDVIINIGKNSQVPAPPPGQQWKEVRHDNTVTWLVSWTENIMGNVKYIMLNPSSKLKAVKDWKKYEKARELHLIIDKIREDYKKGWKDREMVKRQTAVALYFIDRLALRAGNEKDDNEVADTVGCCSLRCEHIKLYDQLNDKEYVVEFDFLGKDSIRYFNQVAVEKRVYKNLKLFMEGKKPNDDLFDRLDTSKLNAYLNNNIMEGLTAKVFRTYNASITLERELERQMEELGSNASVAEKMLAYNRANREVAILCNHQRTESKGHQESMNKLDQKIKDVKKKLKESSDTKAKTRLKEQLKKLKVQKTDKDENKTIALGTSKLNYLDPRISIAWCKEFEVPIERVFSRTQRDKFRWAIHMADKNYRFDKHKDGTKIKTKASPQKLSSPEKKPSSPDKKSSDKKRKDKDKDKKERKDKDKRN